MKAMRWVLLLMAAPGAAGLAAQSPQVRDGLELPDRVVVCRVMPPLKSAPDLRAVEMVEGTSDPEGGRRFAVQADTLDQITNLAVFGTDSLSDGRQQTFGLAVQFRSPPKAFRFLTVDSSAGRPSSSTKEPLTEIEVGRALSLAQWLWAHRCGKNPSDPPGAGQRRVSEGRRDIPNYPPPPWERSLTHALGRLSPMRPFPRPHQNGVAAENASP